MSTTTQNRPISSSDIPTALTKREQWVLWKREKGTKVPYQCTGERAKSTDPTTWTSYARVCDALQRGGYAGVGYVFAADDPYTGIDLDDCINNEGRIEDWAMEIIESLASYSEFSPSGQGVKIWVEGKIPDCVGVTKWGTGAIEMYDERRYFTVTGWRLNFITPPEICPADGALLHLYHQLRPEVEDTTAPTPPLPRVACKDDYLERWATRIISEEVARVAQAAAGERHNVRLKAARRVGGLIPHGLASTEQLEGLLFAAQRPATAAQWGERSTIRDGLKHGAAAPLPLPEPPPPQPVFDTAGVACCPEHGTPLVAAKNGNGWRCEQRRCFWWLGEGYTPPRPPETAAAPQRPQRWQSEDAPPMTADDQVAQRPRRWLTEDEVDLLKPPTWLINGIVPAGEVTMIIGAGDVGKTFIVLDMAKRVAQHYPIMYVAAEDAAGIKVRKRAWELHHRLNKNGNFLMWGGALPLFEDHEVSAFIHDVRALGLRLVVIDTLSQSIAGADENSSKDMTLVMQNCQRIATQTGAAVVVIHHTTKGGETYRGSSTLKNNTYGFLDVSRDDELIRFDCGRIKNTRPFASRFFRLVSVATDIRDEQGAPVTSCVIEPAANVIQGDKLTRNPLAMLEILLNATDATGGASTTELQTATGLNGNSFYGALKRLRNLGLAQKGDRRTDPLTITSAGRERLASESPNPEHQYGGAGIATTPPFEVNTALLPVNGALLPIATGSNLVAISSGWNTSREASYQVPTSGLRDTQAVATVATSVATTATGSNGLLTTPSPSPLGGEVGSNEGSKERAESTHEPPFVPDVAQRGDDTSDHAADLFAEPRMTAQERKQQRATRIIASVETFIQNGEYQAAHLRMSANPDIDWLVQRATLNRLDRAAH